jgi:hypothetical protein
MNRFFICFFLVIFSVFAQAETIPATNAPRAPQSLWRVGSYMFYASVDKLAVCRKVLGPTAFIHAGGSCYRDSSTGAAFEPYSGCINNDVDMVIISCPIEYSCPSGQNWTLSGTSCTRPDCVAPQTRQSDGTCADPCPAAGSAVSGVTGKYFKVLQIPESGLCISGCTYAYGGTSARPAAGDYWISRSGVSTGAHCLGGVAGIEASLPADPNTNTCLAKNLCGGVLNGVEVCTSCEKTSVQSTSTASRTNPDGTTGSTSTTTITTCDAAGKCTTRTTQNNAGGGAQAGSTAQTGTTTSESSIDKVSFCADKPNDPACAKQSDCDKNPDLAQCKSLGTPDAESALPSTSVSISNLSPVDLPGIASCPANIPLPRGAYFDWTPACTYATALKPLVLVMAWLAAGLIVMGVVRG